VLAIIVWLAAFTYAVIRYVVVGPVPVEQIPLFVFNKSLSFGALLLFALTFGLTRAGMRPTARTFGVFGTWLVFAHVIISLVLFATDAFPKFLGPSGQLLVRSQLAILAGVAGALALVWHHRQPSHRLARVVRHGVVAITVLHVAAWGWPGWFAPHTWHGGMPPITLLAALIGTGGLALGWLPRRARRDVPVAIDLEPDAGA